MAVTQELNDYVQKARQAGMSDAVIRDELLKIGWGAADIDVAVPLPVPNPPQPILQNPFQGGPVSEAKPLSQVQTPAQTLPPMRHSRIPFIITIVVLLLAGGAIYYFLPQIVTYADKLIGKILPAEPVENEPVNTMPIVPPDETASWPSYRNEEYGFEFKYPNDFVIGDGSNSTSSNDIQVLVTRVDENNEPVMNDRVFVLKNIEWDSELATIAEVIDSLKLNQPLVGYWESFTDDYTIARFKIPDVTPGDNFEYAVISDGSHNVVLQFNPIAAADLNFIERFIADFRIISQSGSPSL